jgi:hypothetical protein
LGRKSGFDRRAAEGGVGEVRMAKIGLVVGQATESQGLRWWSRLSRVIDRAGVDGAGDVGVELDELRGAEGVGHIRACEAPARFVREDQAGCCGQVGHAAGPSQPRPVVLSGEGGATWRR